MKHNLQLYLFQNASDDNYLAESNCTALSIEREAYTPYESADAVFLSSGADYSNVTRIAIYQNNNRIFLGMVDSITQYTRNHSVFVRIHSKSFTSVLTQNELAPGLHSNLTMEKLMTDYYDFPNITYESPEDTGYIFVKSGNTMWDGVVSFGYKITGHYPYVIHNHIYLSKPANRPVISPDAVQVLEYGTVIDDTRLISHYHMESLAGEPDAYQLKNPSAAAAEIVRHKQIPFDRAFIHDPEDALVFRSLYSRRGCRAKYVLYHGFENAHIGHRLAFGDFITEETICRVRLTFGAQGFRTKLWCYDDGFYHS